MTKQKTIWLINQYASTPETGMGGRHFYLATELAKQGYKVYLIASAANHLLRQPQSFEESFKLESVGGFTFVWVKMPSYTEAHSKQRAINWFLFPWRIQSLPSVIVDQPDVILYSSPSPIAFLGAQRLAKRFNAKLVFEVRDIWPLTLTEIGGYSPSHPFIRLMQWIEDKAYRDSDYVVSNLKNAVEHMVSRGMSREKFMWVPNGFGFDEVSNPEPLAKTTLEKIPKNKFIIGYTGTLGVANALDVLLCAASLVKDYPDIVFVLVGGGKDKVILQQKAELDGLNNIYFVDPIPKVQIQTMLAKFDICFIGWHDNPLYRFGIGANKIPEYLISGKPVLHSYSGGGDPIALHCAGITVDAENAEALAAGVLKLYNMSLNERQAMGENGRKAAIEQYEYGMLAKKLAGFIFG